MCVCVCVCTGRYVGGGGGEEGDRREKKKKRRKDVMKKVVPSVFPVSCYGLFPQPPPTGLMSHFQTTSTTPARFAFSNVALLLCISAQNLITRVFGSRCSIGCWNEKFGDEDVMCRNYQPQVPTSCAASRFRLGSSCRPPLSTTIRWKV